MKRYQLIMALFASFLLLVEGVQARITLPSFFSDGMVLQQQSAVAIWGSSDRKRQKVTVKTSWNAKKYTAVTDESGNWKVKVETPVYGGPYSIEVSDGEPVHINNVLIGLVWLCSGQSNMDMRVSGNYGDPVIGSLDAIVTSGNPEVRMFMVGSKMTSEPLTDCEGIWQEASSETVPGFSATGYFFARKLNQVLKVPVGIIHASYGGSRVEAWMSEEGIEPYKDLSDVHNASILYNGMLSPVVGYGIRGCLWYQGEANVGRADEYADLFMSLISDWRDKWKQPDMPFYFVQLANFLKKEEIQPDSEWAALREAQSKALYLNNTGMAVTTDLGEANNIHPKNKQEVGLRLSHLALHQTYKKIRLPQSPLFKSYRIEGNTIRIGFDNPGKGFMKPDTIKGFIIAGADHIFYPATVTIQKKEIIVESPDVPHPVAVRYNWADNPDGNLYGLSGLPTAPFRTDNW